MGRWMNMDGRAGAVLLFLLTSDGFLNFGSHLGGGSKRDRFESRNICWVGG